MPRPRKKPDPPRRRKRGTGTVRQRADGLWEARLPAGKSSYHREKIEATTWLDRQLNPVTLVPGADESLGDYLGRWYDRNTPRWSGSRAAAAKAMMGRVQSLAGVPLGALRADVIGDWIATLNRAGLAPGTVRLYRTLLKQALSDAVPDVLLANPVGRRAAIPTAQDEGPKHWSQLDSERFLKLAGGTYAYPIFILLLGTGMRLGEALALRWRDVDLSAGIAEVSGSWDQKRKQRGPTKSRRSRTVTLTPRVVRTLDAAEGVRAGYLFQGPKAGQPYSHSSVERLYLKILELAAAAGAPFPPIKLHGLRHTFATVTLDRGVPVAVVAEALGHANAGVTSRVYQHALRQRTGDAERALAEALGWF